MNIDDLINALKKREETNNKYNKRYKRTLIGSAATILAGGAIALTHLTSSLNSLPQNLKESLDLQRYYDATETLQKLEKIGGNIIYRPEMGRYYFIYRTEKIQPRLETLEKDWNKTRETLSNLIITINKDLEEIKRTPDYQDYIKHESGISKIVKNHFLGIFGFAALTAFISAVKVRSDEKKKNLELATLGVQDLTK